MPDDGVNQSRVNALTLTCSKDQPIQILTARRGDIFRRGDAELACASGARTRLKKVPVMLVNIRSEISANRATLSERNRETFWANFIEHVLYSWVETELHFE
jgi:hypothetical protein